MTSFTGVAVENDDLHWRQDFDISGHNVMNVGIIVEVLQRWLGPERTVQAMTNVHIKERRDPQTRAFRPVRVPDSFTAIGELASGAERLGDLAADHCDVLGIHALETLGIEVVADLGGTVIPGADNTPVISQLVEANADMVWTTLSTGTLTEAMLGASVQGYEPMWSGNVPSFSYLMLGGDLGPLLDTNYIVNTYIVTWNTPGVPGLETLKAEMKAAMPDAVVSDSYVIGWTEAQAAHQALEQAAKNRDMTRAGVVRAFNEITVDYDGLAPTQSWGGGDPNAAIVRETYTYDVVLADYDAGATLAEGGGTGTVLVEGPRAADITKAHTFTGACYQG